MKKILLIFAALICMSVGASAAEYNLNNNLLFGLDPKNVTVSAGNITTDGDASKTTRVLYDGLADSATGSSGTRWAVESSQFGAELQIDFGKIVRVGTVAVASGYSDLSAPKPEIFEAFDILYWDGSDYVTAAQVRENFDKLAQIDVTPFYAEKIKIVSKTANNFRVREVIILPPGVSMYDPSPLTGNVTVTYNGEQMRFYKDNPILSHDGSKILVPLRSCAETMGAAVNWDDELGAAIVTADGRKIIFTPGSDKVSADGREYDGGTQVLMYESRVYVPIRIFGEIMNCEVDWDENSNSVNLMSYEYAHMINPGNREYTSCKVYADGAEKTVFTTINCDFVQIEADGEVNIEVETGKKLETADIRPLSRGIVPQFEKGGSKLSFAAEPGQFLSVETNGDLDRPLFVFVNRKIAVPQSTDVANVLYYEGGKHHNVGIKTLDDNTIVYLGENAVINGGFTARGKKNIKIIGNGIINATAMRGSCTAFTECENVEINGPVAVGANQWINRWFCVDGGSISDYKILGSIVYSDGIDLLGSKNINVNNIFVRNEDDGIAIKTKKASTVDVSGNAENIDIRNCVFWNGESGNSMEIGYELDGDYVKNIKYSDIDVIHRGTKANKFNRAAISIHHVGNSTVSDVLYENIRVESTDEGLVNISFFDMPNFGSGNGRIENITIKNLDLIGGADAPSYISDSANTLKNPIKNIVFENLIYKGKKIKSVGDAVACGFKIDSGVDVKFIWRDENE